MKTRQVFDPSTVAHYWANQTQQSARTSGDNFYFNGNIIYSYGNHFAIGVIDNRNGQRTVIFTTRSYSNTTAKHINEAESATSHINKIYCAYPDKAINGDHTDNINSFESAAKQSANKLPKAVKPEKYLIEIAEQKEALNKYVAYFKVKKSELKGLHYINIVTKDGAIKASAAEQKRIEKERKEAEIRREQIRIEELAEDQKTLNKWRKFSGYYKELNTPHFRELDNTFLRFNKSSQEVETSKAVQIPVKMAERFYKWLKHQLKKGGCTGNCDHKILGYNVDQVNKEFILIGCHNVTWLEIEKIAKKLGWS